MKYLFFLLFSVNCFAQNFASMEMIQAELPKGVYGVKETCEKAESKPCIDIGGDVYSVMKGAYAVKNVYGGPKLEVETCSSESECYALLGEKSCSMDQDAFINDELNEVYCIAITGKRIEVDQAKKAAYLQAEAQKVAMEKALAVAKKLRECGGRVMDLMLVRNQPKGLSSEQVKALVSTYAPIQGLLSSGSLVSAKEEIAKVTADGVLVTEADKAALSSQIDKCLAGSI